MAYQNRIDQMRAEIASWQQIVDKWPGSEADIELTPRIAANKREIATLSNRILSILANVRRAA